MSKLLKAQRHAVEKRIIAGLGTALERAPWSTCRLVGGQFGLAFFYGSRTRRNIAISNLQLAFPHLSDNQARQLARQSAQNFGMSFCEFLHLRTASAQSIREYADIDGLEHIQKGLEQGRGVILPTAHFGAWEVMAARVTQEFPLTVIVRLTSNKALRDHILRVRDAINVGMILKTESPRKSLRALRENGGLGVFPDQYAGREGALMPMFGHETRVFTTPSRLALQARAPIVPAYAVRRKPWFSNGRVTITVSPGLYLHDNEYSSRDEAVMEGTRYIQTETEDIIRRHPEQWLWMHRRWRLNNAMKDNGESESGG